VEKATLPQEALTHLVLGSGLRASLPAARYSRA